jgi:hypothetical protein
VFLVLGLGLPVLTYYLPQIVKGRANGITIIAPPATPYDAIHGFASNAGQLGTLVVTLVAAANLAIDANPGLAAFYRSRIQRPVLLVLPRYAAVTAASVATLALGTLAAWYETRTVIGAVSFGPLLAGFALEALWLCFVTSVVALAAGMVRSVTAIVGYSIVFLLALSLIQSLPEANSWLPTRLSGGVSALVGQPFGDTWHAVVITGIFAVAALAGALKLFGSRDVARLSGRAH